MEPVATVAEITVITNAQNQNHHNVLTATESIQPTLQTVQHT